MQVGWGRSPAHAPTAGKREASLERSWGASRPSQAGSRQQAGRQWGQQVQRAEGGHTGKRAHAQKAGLSQGKSPGSMLFTLILQEGAEPASIEYASLN